MSVPNIILLPDPRGLLGEFVSFLVLISYTAGADEPEILAKQIGLLHNAFMVTQLMVSARLVEVVMVLRISWKSPCILFILTACMEKLVALALLLF